MSRQSPNIIRDTPNCGPGVGREREWASVTRSHFDSLTGPQGVLVVGGPERVAEKLISHSEALGGVDRFTFQMDNAGLMHSQLMISIGLIGKEVISLVNGRAA